MQKAKDLISNQVVVGMAEERLLNVSVRLRQRRAHCCVVLGPPAQFLGLIALKDVASLSNPGNRILADMIDTALPAFLDPDEPAAAVAERFEREELQEAVVLAPDKTYLGVVTVERLFQWAQAELRARRK